MTGGMRPWRSVRAIGRPAVSLPAVAAGALAGAGVTCALFLMLGGEPALTSPAPAPAGQAPASAVPSAAIVAAQERPSPGPTGSAGAVDDSRRTAIVAAADRVGRAVVAISARFTQQANPYAGTVWEDFFPMLRRPMPVQSLGSGFIISPEGYVLTNDHVVEGAEEVRVTLVDGREFPAAVVGVDPTTDLAVLRLSAPGGGSSLPVAPLGSSEALLIGEWAIAIGNPFAPLLADANPSVTVGVISALHRDVRPSPGEEHIWTDMIQTDASINPGNSGGPLVNASGEVVGVNSFIFSRSGESIGIGFAIPIERARRVADDLIRYGKVRLTWIGVHVEDAPEPGPGGDPDAPRVNVTRVDPASPAERAGVRAGDALLAANGRRLLSALDWEGRQIDFRVGEAVELELVRDGRRSRLTFDGAPDPVSSAPEREAPLGLRVAGLTPALRSYLEVRAEAGMLVTAVAPGSPAQRIGLEQGDVLLAVNDRRVTSLDEGLDLLGGITRRSRVSLVWEREGRLFRWEG